MIVTMKILQCAVKPVSVKRGWRYMRVCNLGYRKVSIVRIMRVNFRKNIWAFRRDKRNYLLYTGVCIKWVSAERGPTVVYSYFEKGCRKKVPATIQKGVVGGFQFTDDFQRNLKERHERPWTVCCECWRKATKVGSTVTVSRNSVLIISYITFRDCHLHFFRQPFSTCGSCLLNTHLLNRTFLSFRFPSWCQFDKRTCAVCKCCWILGGRRCRQVCNHLGTLLGTHMSLNDPCLQHTCGLWCKTRYNRGLKSKKYECQTTSVYFFVPGTEL